MSRRTISHTEITAAYECQAKHAFAYTGHLTGGVVLEPHAPAARLRAGRAWGRGVAEFHRVGVNDTRINPLCSEAGLFQQRYMIALRALNESLDEDVAAMREHGFYDDAEHHDMNLRLADILWHYAQTAEPLQISDPEFELLLPIPSRSGRGVSNRYAFEGRLDGIAAQDARLWLVEYKLRDQLSDYESIARGRQYRRYVWAAERQLGVRIAGIIVDERLSVAPKPARWVKAKRKGEGIDGRVPSHAKDQLTTSTLYAEACLEADVLIDRDTFDSLHARKWQARHRIILRRSEIEEAGRELVSAAQYIAQLDSGALFPVRNPAPWRCGGCAFKSICNDPSDREVVEANFDLREPKRLRVPLLEGSAS